mmetsp:Transcript_50434/g.96349  ORF Transcript_50434/g.96349 Transcript_50434/m.96349 type:complete len:222 (+) Transcript_50434:524-1189(+)
MWLRQHLAILVGFKPNVQVLGESSRVEHRRHIRARAPQRHRPVLLTVRDFVHRCVWGRLPVGLLEILPRFRRAVVHDLYRSNQILAAGDALLTSVRPRPELDEVVHVVGVDAVTTELAVGPPGQPVRVRRVCRAGSAAGVDVEELVLGQLRVRVAVEVQRAVVVQPLVAKRQVLLDVEHVQRVGGMAVLVVVIDVAHAVVRDHRREEKRHVASHLKSHVCA